VVPKKEDDISKSCISNMKTDIAILKSNNSNTNERITRHRVDVTEKLNNLTDSVDKIVKVMWEGGLVSTVKSNSEWIKDQCSQKNKTMNFIYRAIILIIISYVAVKIGLK